jgi:4-hydroxy-L-threonine phosphate dehydrogenase PdxA
MSINVTLGNPASIGAEAVLHSRARVSEAVTAAATASGATAATGEVWVVTAEADVFVQFAVAPTGVAPRWRLRAGETRFFVATAGDKVAWAAT